jgi:hypothetical protein
MSHMQSWLLDCGWNTHYDVLNTITRVSALLWTWQFTSRFHKKEGGFLTSWGTVSFRRNPLHGFNAEWGRAVAQAEGWFQSNSSPHEICINRSETGARLPLTFEFPPINYYSNNASIHSLKFIRCTYNGHVQPTRYYTSVLAVSIIFRGFRRPRNIMIDMSLVYSEELC